MTDHFYVTADAEVVMPCIPLYVGAECIGHAWGVDNLTRAPSILRTEAVRPLRETMLIAGEFDEEPPIDDEEGGESGWDYLRHTPEYTR